MEARADSFNRMTSDGTDLVIVSAYGRGNWLATELAGRGWKVTLADVSESLGSWQPEDTEGPFGLLESADLLTSQKTRLLDEGETTSLPAGFTFWLKEGPLECRSEMTAFELSRHGISRAVETYLRHPGLADKESERERRGLLKQSFRDTWLAHLAHQLASPVMEENHRSLDRGEALPIFAPFSMRQVSANGLQKGLRSVQAGGAVVRLKASILDVRISGKSVDAIEIADERAGIESSRAFVWMLTSRETERSTKNVFATLYPRGAIEPEWYWARFQLTMKGNAVAAEADQLPAHLVIVEDPFLPWTHANVMVMRKRPAPAQYDVWLRLPTRIRFDSEYLRGMGREIETVLMRRAPLLAPTIEQLPIETRFEEKRLGPPRIAVYAPATLEKLETLKASNFFFCSSEQCAALDWVGQYRRQNEIVTKLEKLRAQWQAKQRALEARQGSKADSSGPRNPSP